MIKPHHTHHLSRMTFAASTFVAIFMAVVFVHSHHSTRPYVTDTNPATCATAVAYLKQHAEPHFAIDCPVNLPGDIVSDTCLPAIFPNGCITPVIRISARACFTAVEDEASNSWILTSYARSGQIPDGVKRGGVPTFAGQYGIDNFGEC